MDGKDVEEIFKGVLTDESQDSHDAVMQDPSNTNAVTSSTFTLNHTNVNANPSVVNNQQQGVIISQGPPAMSPSHTGSIIFSALTVHSVVAVMKYSWVITAIRCYSDSR